MSSILIVDDEPLVREAYAAFLGMEGYEVLQADSVSAAKDHLTQQGIDLVLTDYRMPGEDGLGLLNYINENFPSLMVIMVTGNPDSEGTVQAFAGGVVEFLVKPVDRMTLVNTVGKLLGQDQKVDHQENDEIDSLLNDLQSDS